MQISTVRVLSAPPIAVLDEARAAATWLLERQLWLVLLAGLALWTLAYQVPYSYRVEFGGDQQTHRRYDDQPFINRIEGWNQDPEPTGDQWFEPGQPPPYRWAFEHAQLTFPGVGLGDWQVSVYAAGQPTAAPTLSRWSDGTITTTVALTQQPRVYQQVFGSRGGDLALTFDTPPYPADPAGRPLGFVGFWASVYSLPGPRLPAPLHTAALGLACAAAYALCRRLGAGPGRAAAFAGALALAFAALLALWRIPFALVAPQLGLIGLGCYGLGCALLRLPLLAWARAEPSCAPGREHAWLVALVLAAFAVRAAGLFHPAIIFSDIGLNVNKQLLFFGGHVYQQAGLPAELGGGEAPYPPAQYIALAPLHLLTPPWRDTQSMRQQIETVLKVGNALLDSLVAAWIWVVLRRARYGPAAALLGAALYVCPGPALKSFGVGEFANIAGQSLAIPLIAALADGPERLRGRARSAGALALLLLAVLGHSGVTISVALLLGALGLIWLAGLRRWRAALALALLGALAAALVGLLYYSTYLDLFRAQIGLQGDPAPQFTLLEKLSQQGGRVFGGPLSPVSPLLMGAGLSGLGLAVWQRRSPGFAAALLAWWASAALALGMLAVRGQTVRWDLFLYPALCLSAGPLLGALWRRGPAARLLAAAGVAALLAQGAAFWFEHIRDFLH